MANNYSSLLSNDRIKLIICFWNFFNNLKVLAFMLNSLHNIVVNLSDCYLGMAYIAASFFVILTKNLRNTAFQKLIKDLKSLMMIIICCHFFCILVFDRLMKRVAKLNIVSLFFYFQFFHKNIFNY